MLAKRVAIEQNDLEAHPMLNTQQASEGSSMRSALAQGRAFAHIAKFHPELTSFRRDLHANPELGFEEIYTSARVIEALKVCGVDSVHTHKQAAATTHDMQVCSYLHRRCRARNRVPGFRCLSTSRRASLPPRRILLPPPARAADAHAARRQ